MTGLLASSLTEICEALRRGSASPVDLMNEVLSAIASITREGDTDERMAARSARDDDTPARMEDRKDGGGASEHMAER